jgi:nitrogen fixation protein FixH
MKDFTPINRFAEVNRFADAVVASDRGNGVTHAAHQSRDSLVGREILPRLSARPAPAPRRFWPWPGMIFLLLASNVAIVLTCVYVATSDRSFSIEPDYYRKAVHWDRSVAQRQRNSALGWNMTVAPAAPIAARLVDHDAQPIGGAQIEVVAFHNAHSGNRLETMLEEIEPGLYRSAEVLTRSGSWELRFTAKVGGETFTQNLTHLVLQEPAS